MNGITNANTTSWEVRYGFSSTEVSLITVAHDIAAGLLVLPITYFGANAHQMRIMSISALIMGCGSIVMCIPHWSSGIYNVEERVQLHCDTLGTASFIYQCFCCACMCRSMCIRKYFMRVYVYALMNELMCVCVHDCECKGVCVRECVLVRVYAYMYA